MRFPTLPLLTAAVCALALGVGVAAAAPPQNDTIFVNGVPGSPTVNGCPAGTLYISIVNPPYGAPALADANGDGFVCAHPLPDAARTARVPGAPDFLAFYEFLNNTARVAVKG